MRHRSRALALSLATVLAAACSSGAGAPTWTFGPTTAGTDAASPSAALPASHFPGSASPADGSEAPSPAISSPDPAASPSTVPTRAAVDPREGGFAVGFGEWAVEPEAAAVRPGKITFVVRNGGALTHEFEIESEERGDGEEFELEGPEFGPGGMVQVDAALRAGTYKIYCSIGDHEERGMVTQLVVREDAPLVTPPPATVDVVEIRGFAFGPDTIRVTAGTEVTWRNADSADHTVTAEAGAFGSDALGNGETFTTRLQDAGTYAYFCAIHPTMKGTIEVR